MIDDLINKLKSSKVTEQTFCVTEELLRELWSSAQEVALTSFKENSSTGPAGLISPVQMNYVPKPWGWELWICNNSKYCGKKLFVKQGRWLSYHHHEIKDEVLFVESGSIRFVYSQDGGTPKSTMLSAGYAYHVTPNIKHQLEAIEDSVVFEFSTQHFDEDSHRTTRDRIVTDGIYMTPSQINSTR